MDDKNICVNVRLMTDDILGTAAANRKLSRKVRGLGGWIFGLVVTCVVLISELAERKRCEKYLEEQIDDLKEKFDEDAKSNASDTINIQQQIDKLKEKQDSLSKDFYCNCGEVTDGGVCDA